LKGTEVGYQHPDEFLIHKVIETKRGNTIINGIIYLLLSELLDIPVKAINIPRQFVLAYIKPELDGEDNNKAVIDRIEFFIDPMSGQVFTQKDVMNYFNRIAITPSDIHFKPSNHIRIMQSLLEEFSKCFDNESNLYKKTELLMLSRMLSE
jgi:regulator of sirC expression with transglutaminase-like and TPR domain